MAPEARVVSVKLADASGATDVSQVIAGIDWVVQSKNRNGLNIRVLNLSFGTDGVQSYLLDPLTYAAEVALPRRHRGGRLGRQRGVRLTKLAWTAGTWTGRMWSGSTWSGRRWSGGGWN